MGFIAVSTIIAILYLIRRKINERCYSNKHFDTENCVSLNKVSNESKQSKDQRKNSIEIKTVTVSNKNKSIPDINLKQENLNELGQTKKLSTEGNNNKITKLTETQAIPNLEFSSNETSNKNIKSEDSKVNEIQAKCENTSKNSLPILLTENDCNLSSNINEIEIEDVITTEQVNEIENGVKNSFNTSITNNDISTLANYIPKAQQENEFENDVTNLLTACILNNGNSNLDNKSSKEKLVNLTEKEPCANSFMNNDCSSLINYPQEAQQLNEIRQITEIEKDTKNSLASFLTNSDEGQQIDEIEEIENNAKPSFSPSLTENNSNLLLNVSLNASESAESGYQNISNKMVTEEPISERSSFVNLESTCELKKTKASQMSSLSIKFIDLKPYNMTGSSHIISLNDSNIKKLSNHSLDKDIAGFIEISSLENVDSKETESKLTTKDNEIESSSTSSSSKNPEYLNSISNMKNELDVNESMKKETENIPLQNNIQDNNNQLLEKTSKTSDNSQDSSFDDHSSNQKESFDNFRKSEENSNNVSSSSPKEILSKSISTSINNPEFRSDQSVYLTKQDSNLKSNKDSKQVLSKSVDLINCTFDNSMNEKSIDDKIPEFTASKRDNQTNIYNSTEHNTNMENAEVSSENGERSRSILSDNEELISYHSSINVSKQELIELKNEINRVYSGKLTINRSMDEILINKCITEKISTIAISSSDNEKYLYNSTKHILKKETAEYFKENKLWKNSKSLNFLNEESSKVISNNKTTSNEINIQDGNRESYEKFSISTIISTNVEYISMKQVNEQLSIKSTDSTKSNFSELVLLNSYENINSVSNKESINVSELGKVDEKISLINLKITEQLKQIKTSEKSVATIKFIDIKSFTMADSYHFIKLDDLSLKKVANVDISDFIELTSLSNVDQDQIGSLDSSSNNLSPLSSFNNLNLLSKKSSNCKLSAELRGNDSSLQTNNNNTKKNGQNLQDKNFESINSLEKNEYDRKE